MPDPNILKSYIHLHRDAVFVHFPDSVNAVDMPIKDVNNAACLLLGYSREELLTLTMKELSPPENWGVSDETNSMHNYFMHSERDLIAKDGNKIPVETDAHSLDVDNVRVNIIICRDISERRRNEQEKILNTQRLRALCTLSQMLDESEQDILNYAMEESVRITNSEVGYIFMVNDQETELTLQSWSKATTSLCKICDPPTHFKVQTRGMFTAPLLERKPIIFNTAQNSDSSLNMPEGHVSLERTLHLPIINNGHVVLITGLANKDEDYTDEDLVQVTLLMEAGWRIVQRKRMDDDLRETKLAAEKANAAKDRFLANMSHELRTPLNGILGMTQILMNTELNAEQREYLSLALDASRQLNKVLADLLALSSIESGGITLAEVEFNFHEAMNTLVPPITLQAESKCLLLNYTISPDVPAHLKGDLGKLRQILINLLFNAIKFTQRGEISLSISTSSIDKPADNERCNLIFSVSDTGMGIPEDKLDSIFESFTLGEDYLTKEYGGTGLGLSISRQLAALMNGHITVTSEVGKGSTFTLSIPFEAIEIQPNCNHDAQRIDFRQTPLKILLAEDEQVNSIMASRLLKKEGHSVTIVGNGQEVLERLNTEQYDLILMDVQMPIINGLQATEFIRKGAVENAPLDIPIIGLTAFARSKEKKQFLNAGMNSIVTKPYEVRELSQAVKMTMQKRTQREI